MADAAVEFLLLNLKQLLVYNADLISGVKEQVESLYNELSMLKAFLKDSTEKRSEYEIVKELVRQIRVVVYEAEDVIDTFVVHTSLQKARSGFSKVIHGIDYPGKLRIVAKEIRSIRKRVDDLYRKQSFGFGVIQQQAGEKSGRGSPDKKAPVVEEENVVGFDQEAEILVARLNGGKEEMEVVSVIGMGGLGKTTLARKVFTGPVIEYEFYIRAWIYVSQEYSRKEVFLGILNSINKLTDEMYKWSDEKLAEELRVHLHCGRYLIVIDDVWTKGAWDDLKMAFPKNNNKSRILLTSRNNDVAIYANPDSPPHHLRFLSDDESWELLEKKVFRKERCPLELEDLGKKIAKECSGLPLAIVVIAGLLMKKDKTCEWWERVAESVSSYVARDPKQCMDILALSYKHLPYHLKACFLYFGVFPEDYEIPVWKLIQLWVAEGFIQQVGEISLEDIAEEQLEDLVDRNLVMVDRRRSNGGIKTCRVHDMLHDLCLREAEEEKFLQEIKGFVLVPCSSFSPNLNKYRRLCIHNHVLNYISSKPSGPHVRSFLCFAVEQGESRREHTAFIHEAFKLLRVLEMRSISLPVFPVKMKELVHLRYIALHGDFEILPASISYLWNLQTVIIETTSRTLKVEADIWKMLQLRHFFTNASSRLRGPPTNAWKSGKDPLVRRNLQTLSTISPESCTEDILARTPNLKKLGVRGKLRTLMEEKGGSSLFDNLTKLDHLVTLKLLNDTFPDRPSSGSLPPLYKFPPNLKKLTLADTLLDWEHMAILGILPKLEVLKLKDNAFKGERWEPLDGGFRLLRFLQIGRTDLVHWEGSSHHFPRLHRLILKHCESLKAVPSGLGDVSALQIIEVYHSSHNAVASVKQIQTQKQQGVAINQLKLLIYPPE
ncbi:disease resistance protein RPP13-like [Rhododendron vialii]|uniref:disease resistance protein RPP13-like n=1 Tax=Rhododendron vialii TaxID=182163 RepID=UPI00265FBD92|nr:disease resistance protein RPP13-like [Rhododendron vialii]XP_058182951.1 disease resistance protein RPP13-like [Rhododendron vialii]XP_058182952.1 disease resistance protein RPP13-like [Rhododendron vialii]